MGARSMDGKEDADARQDNPRDSRNNSMPDGRSDGRLGGRSEGSQDSQQNGRQDGVSGRFEKERFDIPAGDRGSNSMYDLYESTFRDASSVFDALQRLSGRGVAEDAIDHSLNWLILSAWSNLDKMKELQDDMIDRLQKIKEATGITN